MSRQGVSELGIERRTEYTDFSALVRRCIEHSIQEGTDARSRIKVYREYAHRPNFRVVMNLPNGRVVRKRFSNKIFTKYNATVGIISSTEPAIEYMPKDGQPVGLGEAISRRCADIWGEGGFAFVLQRLQQIAVRDGLAWLEPCYLPDPAKMEKPGGIALYAHDSMSVVHDPDAKSVEQLRFVMVLEDITQAQLDMFYPGWRGLDRQGGYTEDWNWLKELGGGEGIRTETVGGAIDGHETIVRGYMRQLPSLDKLIASFLKKRDKVSARTVEEIVRIGGVERASEVFARRGVLIRMVQGGVLTLEPLMYESDTLPMIPHNYLPALDGLWGISMIHPLVDPQDARDEQNHAMHQIMLHDGVPETLVDAQTFSKMQDEEKAEVGRIRIIEPGGMYEHRRGIGFDPAFLQLHDRTDQDIESISGHRDLSTMFKGQIAARALSMAAEIAETPLIPVRFQLEKTVKLLGEHVLRIMRANTIAPVSVEMPVTDVNRSWLTERLGGEAGAEDAVRAKVEISGGDMQGDWQVRAVLKQGSAMEREAERSRIREDALLLSRLPPPMFGPVAEALGFPHWQEISEQMAAERAKQEAMRQEAMQQEAMRREMTAAGGAPQAGPGGGPPGEMEEMIGGGPEGGEPSAPMQVPAEEEDRLSDEEMAAAMSMLAQKGEL